MFVLSTYDHMDLGKEDYRDKSAIFITYQGHVVQTWCATIDINLDCLAEEVTCQVCLLWS